MFVLTDCMCVRFKVYVFLERERARVCMCWCVCVLECVCVCVCMRACSERDVYMFPYVCFTVLKSNKDTVNASCTWLTGSERESAAGCSNCCQQLVGRSHQQR